MTRDRHRAVWAAPRHHARWGGDGPAVEAPSGTAFARTIDGTIERTWNASGDVRTTQ
jgi:hypothetical protein